MDLPYWKIARNLNISVGTTYNVFKAFESSGEVSCNPPQDRRDSRSLTSSEEMFVVGLVFENPCLYLRELCQQVQDISGLSVSVSTICRLLRRHGLSRKSQESPREQLVWIDEMGSDRRDAMRQYGYALLGETPRCKRLQVRGQRISAIAAISSAGMVSLELEYGSVNSDTFHDFVRGSLISNMHPYDGIAIMANCSIHHVNAVTDLFQVAGVMVVFLPPYSPDYNPIELAFSSVKYFLKEHDMVMQAMQDPVPLIKGIGSRYKGMIARAPLLPRPIDLKKFSGTRRGR